MQQLANAWSALVNHFLDDRSCTITGNKSMTSLFTYLNHEFIHCTSEERGTSNPCWLERVPQKMLCHMWTETGRRPGSLSLLRMGCSRSSPRALLTKGLPWLRGQDPVSPESPMGDATHSTLTPRQAGCTLSFPQRMMVMQAPHTPKRKVTFLTLLFEMNTLKSNSLESFLVLLPDLVTP